MASLSSRIPLVWLALGCLVGCAAASSTDTAAGDDEGGESGQQAGEGGGSGGEEGGTGGASDGGAGGRGGGNSGNAGGGNAGRSGSAGASGGAGVGGQLGGSGGGGGGSAGAPMGGSGGQTPTTLPGDADVVALYTFSEGQGRVAKDSSGYGEALDLALKDNEGSITWMSGGLKFTSPNSKKGPIAHSATPSGGWKTAAKITTALKAANEMTVEMWGYATAANQNGPARILSFARENHHRNFTWLHGRQKCNDAADGNQFQIRVKIDNDDNNGCPEVKFAASVVVPMKMAHMVYVQTTGGDQLLYIDGERVATAKLAKSDFSHWFDDVPLGLGNEPKFGDAVGVDGEHEREWNGVLSTVAIYKRALSASEVGAHFAAGPR